MVAFFQDGLGATAGTFENHITCPEGFRSMGACSLTSGIKVLLAFGPVTMKEGEATITR